MWLAFGALNVARSVSALVLAIRIACQVRPPSKDTCPQAWLTRTAAACWRCATVMWMTWRPALARPVRPSPATLYRSVSSCCTAQCRSSWPVAWLKPQYHGPGTVAFGFGAECQVHTSVPAGESGYCLLARDAFMLNLIRDGLWPSLAWRKRPVPPSAALAALPLAILRPFS